jgi:predicted ester cyclase
MGTAYTVACRGQGKLMLISDTGNSIEFAEQALIQAHRDKLLTGGKTFASCPIAA